MALHTVKATTRHGVEQPILSVTVVTDVGNVEKEAERHLLYLNSRRTAEAACRAVLRSDKIQERIAQGTRDIKAAAQRMTRDLASL